MVDDATCIPIDEARAETPLSATLGTEANEAVRVKLSVTPEGLVVEIAFVGADLPEFARFFGCPAEFGRAVDQGAASDMLEFSNAAVTAPLLTADPTLLKALEPFCDVAAKVRRTASNALRAAVEKEVEKLLPHGKAQRRTIAKALAMSTRTLARRLAVQKTTYEEVVDQLRCSLALQYLKDPGMSLSQIAWQLGYEQSTSFNHAFRRWTGRSPSEVRKRKPLPAPA
jgi:AraC-like DNA-binding protein